MVPNLSAAVPYFRDGLPASKARASATNFQPYRGIRRDMGTPRHNDRKATKSTEPCSDLLEVWLGVLERTEDPRRRRAKEFVGSTGPNFGPNTEITAWNGAEVMD